MKTGIEIIAEERARHATVEGWTPEHDDAHDKGELASAAAAYAMVPRRQSGDDSPEEAPEIWPWDEDWWKPCPNDRVHELAKAGALIAAEIDRLQRASLTPPHKAAKKGRKK